MFTFGTLGCNGCYTDGVILKPEEAWNIDTKIDDGLPGAGKVIAVSRTGWYCVGGNTATRTTSTNFNVIPGAYNLSTSSVQCSLAFAKQF
jgi:hypothetical protein